MPTVFSKILSGQLPARFIWREEEVAAFLTVAPLRPGHTLVVPRRQIDQWTDAEPALLSRCVEVAQVIGQAAKRAWRAPRAGLIIAGFEVPHLHIHVFPAWGLADFHFGNVERNPDPAAMDDAAARLRKSLRELGQGAGVAE
jgi:diadenosine tetraphosphate (Ap4A) HIT family hydrolase